MVTLTDDERRMFEAFRRNNPKGFAELQQLLYRMEDEYCREAAKSSGIENIYRAQGKVAAISHLSSVIKGN